MTKVLHNTGQTLTALCSAVESCGVVPTTEACVDLWEVGREEGGKEGRREVGREEEGKEGGEKKGGEKKGGEKKGGEKKGGEEGKYKVHIECLLCAQSLFPNYTFVLPENEATVRSLGQLLAAVAVQG